MWSSIDTIICHFPKSYKFNKTVVIITFYGVIVKKPLYSSSLKIYKHNKLIIDKLKMLIKNNVSIIFFESVIPKHIKKCTDVFGMFKKENQLPIACVISTKNNKYAKPYTHMWSFIQKIFKIKGKIDIDLGKSLYIGIHAGRKSNSHLRDDKSCIDRSFAHNIQMKFITSNAFFQNDVIPFKWAWSFVPNAKDREILITQNLNNPNILNELEILEDDDSKKKIIVITGLKYSGKTTLSKKVKKIWENKKSINVFYIHFTNETNLEIINTTIHKNIIIDIDINSKSLMNIMKNSMTYKIPTLLVDLVTPNEVISLFNHMSVQTSKTSDVVFDFKIKNKPKYNIFQDSAVIEYINVHPHITATDEYWFKYG